jgi:hypothetical protein
MDVVVWFSRESEVLSEWLIETSNLSKYSPRMKLLAMSDGSSPADFHLMPARLKDILYLDSPDVIISINGIPLISIEVSEEAGTGHNAFQRFSRLAAAVENGVAAFYLYPEAAWIPRKTRSSWDVINPLIFKTLEQVMRLYDVPAFLYYFPTEFSGDRAAKPSKDAGPKGHLYERNPNFPGVPRGEHPQVREMISHLNEILEIAEKNPPELVGSAALKKGWAQKKRDWMQAEWAKRGAGKTWSPITSVVEVSTKSLLDYLRNYAEPNHEFGELLTSRPLTLIYFATGNYRSQGDPYTGAFAAIDYLACREGRSYEERSMNLVIAFGAVDIDGGELQKITGPAEVSDFVEPIRQLYRNTSKVLLGSSYSQLRGKIPRYMMQVRHGTTFTKRKDLRIYAYFADAILFPDGALWRES